MKFLQLILLLSTLMYAAVKTPSDVYSQAMVLKQMIKELRKESGVTKPLPVVAKQYNKLPRHVLQKTLEVLNKVNKYRELQEYGLISVPPVPAREITPQDVYNNIVRLKQEVKYLLKNPNIKFVYKQYTSKTPSDVYQLVWQISLGFDALIGQGFTPTDVYIQSQQIVENIKFLRKAQREYSEVKIPKKKTHLHPNHALYSSINLLKKINEVERKLWMKPIPVPKVQQRVISPTEVYDSLQTVKAELNRITRRIGLESSFPPKKQKKQKTPSDVVQNLEYAQALLPSFDFTKLLNQYPQRSLIKTPNDVYALSEFILDKISIIKDRNGIKVRAKKAPYVYGLQPIYVYVKGLENLEKVQKLKILDGFHPSQIPSSPNTQITPSEVYELILRLDDEINLLYNSPKYNYHLLAYRDYLDKKEYHDKTPSDVYHNLWSLSYELDTILNQQYTPNETYVLANKLEQSIQTLATALTHKHLHVKPKHHTTKSPRDVFAQSLLLMKKLEQIKQRGNFQSASIVIPQDKEITPNTVYNTLRIISGTVSEIHVHYDIQHDNDDKTLLHANNKTPSDVYSIVEATNTLVTKILQDSSYEN